MIDQLRGEIRGTFIAPDTRRAMRCGEADAIIGESPAALLKSSKRSSAGQPAAVTFAQISASLLDIYQAHFLGTPQRPHLLHGRLLQNNHCPGIMGPKKKSDARGGPKPGTKQAKAAAEKSAETAKKAQASTEEPKKPSVKEVIGGASWTGKLPVNMLSEHCQKQKWDKPEYTMVRW